jgi:molybdopterin molybdotransferase
VNKVIVTMAISYNTALEILRDVAKDQVDRDNCTETVPLLVSVGRLAARNHNSPIATPSHDTSAMDGFAFSSAATCNASAARSVVFAVKGIIAAGDDPIALSSEPEDGVFPCVEIMTGARFPGCTSGLGFDACIKIEDTVSMGSVGIGPDAKPYTHIAVKQPVSRNANRRLAGGDMRKGDIILSKGDVVGSRHIMALASVGITEVAVRRKLRVAVWSTGNELSEGTNTQRGHSQIFNSNGPYLIASLRELGVDAEYKGILMDSPGSLQAAFGSLNARTYDLVITTGAVSKGKFDFMVPALEELRAHTRFHGVAIRPGHPVLFATTNDTPHFGLPGNPIAAAACFRFLVVPFLRYLLAQSVEQPETAQMLTARDSTCASISSPAHLDCFRHGMLSVSESGRKTVVISSNQSPAIISHFASSNCWVHIPKVGSSDAESEQVYCYSHALLLR